MTTDRHELGQGLRAIELEAALAALKKGLLDGHDVPDNVSGPPVEMALLRIHELKAALAVAQRDQQAAEEQEGIHGRYAAECKRLRAESEAKLALYEQAARELPEDPRNRHRLERVEFYDRESKFATPALDRDMLSRHRVEFEDYADRLRAHAVALKVERERAEVALAGKEHDHQYHMNAINRLAKFLAIAGTSDDVIDAALDNMKRFARELATARAQERARYITRSSQLFLCHEDEKYDDEVAVKAGEGTSFNLGVKACIDAIRALTDEPNAAEQEGSNIPKQAHNEKSDSAPAASYQQQQARKWTAAMARAEIRAGLADRRHGEVRRKSASRVNRMGPIDRRKKL